jgi:Tfp pilus assembly protein PilF
MQFLGYRVDEVHRTVTRPAGEVVRLEPKAFDLLAYLTQHPQETLSREQLINEVWGGKFVTDDAVMVAVYALRQAFNDDSRKPRFIETIRGRGYRWLPNEGSPARKPKLTTAAYAALIAIAFASLAWAVLRPVAPMPSMKQANAMVRAQARGLFFSERVTRRDLDEARAEFRKAIAIDERFAEPHAALAEVNVRLIEAGDPDTRAREDEARRELKRALDLGPELAMSQAAQASVQFVLDRDVARAERSFRHAIELDPTLPAIRRRYSYLLGATGRFAEATEQAQIGVQMEPTSATALNDLGWAHLLAGRVDAAEQTYREALKLDPVNGATLLALGYCEELRNDSKAAMVSYRRALQIFGAPEAVLDSYDREFAASGLPGVYRAWMQRLGPNKSTPRFVIAFYAARAGRPAEAIALLRQAAERREAGTLWLAVHPAFAPLRNQRDFAEIVASSFHTR